MVQKYKAILLIDDKLTMHSLAKAVLENAGYRFISDYNGPQGLELLFKHKQDLILLDYILPGMNGDQVYAELITNPRYQKVSTTPVIVLTARDSDFKLRSKFLEGGVSAYLQKPFGIRELINVIENIFVYSEIKRRNLQLQDDLRKTHDYLESLIQNTPIGILSTDQQGNILKVNSYLRQILGSNVGTQILGQNLLENNFFNIPELIHDIDRTLKEGHTFQTEPFDFRANSDRQIKLILSGVPLRERDSQEITNSIILVQDVTQTYQGEYELSMISQISDFMQGNVELDQVLHLILTAITAGCAMGFSRAMILLINRKNRVLEGQMGVSPSTQEETFQIWKELGKENISLSNFFEKYGRKTFRNGDIDYFNTLVQKIAIPLSWKDCFFIQVIEQKKSFHVHCEKAALGIPPELLDQLHLDEFIIVPLIAKDKVIRVVIADNQFSHHSIHDEWINLLSLFANQAGLAIERAETYFKFEQEKNKLHKAYEELKNTQERLIHAERLATIGQMAPEVAHEIRNPLVTIGGFSRMIRKKAEIGSKAELLDVADIIAEEVNRLEQIVTKVLDFSQLLKFQLVLENINKIIEKSCSFMISGKEIQLYKELDLLIPMTLMDPQQIKQVLLNLIQNALHSMPGDGSLHITSRIEDEDSIRVSIRDSDQGIPYEMLDDLFNPFFTTKLTGTGLGLPISQRSLTTMGENRCRK